MFDNLSGSNVEIYDYQGDIWYQEGRLEPINVPAVDEWLSDKVHHTFNLEKLTEDSFENVRPRGRHRHGAGRL